MAMPQLAADSVSVVIRGRFNPSRFTPKLMLDDGLIGKSEIDQLEFKLLIPREVVAYSAGWLDMQVTSDLLQVQTSDEDEFERLRDVALGILMKQDDLEVSAMGLNRQVHFQLGSQDAWHAVGDALVKNDAWQGLLDLPGMKSVTFNAVRPDRHAGYYDVKIEPSNVFPRAVYVACNDHYSLALVDAQPTSREDFSRHQLDSPKPSGEKMSVAMRVLVQDWTHSIRRSADVIERVYQQAKL